ncbi:unnamed protein product [Microthlaspi erraticum]|uniref:TF-B3 domain-containing protein n=1 Tax=Microthlaspi erraticum TaxID=1685480 RepID=A0A6D2IBT9_9BRAS|nr:unnamed protein product [Microthlaspi erraticum]
MNHHGKSWTLDLRYNRSVDQACIRRGWRDFCFVNVLEAGSFHRFKLVRNGTKPLLQLCSATVPEGNCSKANGKDHLSEKSSSECSESTTSTKQNNFLTITFKPYMLQAGQLRLSRTFARENGIKKAGEITLVDRNGRKWPSYLTPADEQGTFYLAEGWRSFCKANRFKTGDSFKLEFVENGTTPMLKFCFNAKVKLNKYTLQHKYLKHQGMKKKWLKKKQKLGSKRKLEFLQKEDLLAADRVLI